jgi:hypothetical protein
MREIGRDTVGFFSQMFGQIPWADVAYGMLGLAVLLLAMGFAWVVVMSLLASLYGRYGGR